MGKLRLVTWNANGLPDKKLELTQLLQELDVDVALIQETHLRPGLAVNIPNYQVYRSDRPDGRGGGTAVYIHRRLPHRLLPTNVPRGLEVTTVAVIYNGAELAISSAYNQPGRSLQPRHLDALLQAGSPSLVLGDLNSKHTAWGCRVSNTAGRALQTLLQARPHINLLAPEEPTHYSHAGHLPDILDIGLASSLDGDVEVFAVSDLSSDHVPVVFDLQDDGAPLVPPRRSRKVNWALYSSYLADRPRPPPEAATPAEIDLHVQDLTSLLQDAITASSSTPPAAERSQPLPWDLKEEILQRRRLRRIYQRSRCPRAKAEFQRQARRCSRLLADHRTAMWEEFVETSADDPGGVWRIAKSLRGEKKTIRPLHGQRGLVYTPEAKAEAFADTMEDQFSPHADVYDDDHCEAVENFLEAYDPDVEEEELPPVTADEVSGLIRALRPRKAPGPDSLGTPAMKNLPAWVIVMIAAIFNCCLRLSHFPAAWKEATVILIPKPGKDPLFPENHRPISLLPVLSKMFERIVLARFPEEFFNSIRTEQFGFRRGHSTTLQLRRVITTVTGALERKHHATSVLIDVSKAFDRVWHEGLLYKLATSPLPGSLWKLMKSYLHRRSFSVRVDQISSTKRPISSGVPQGSVLGPILYLWYTNDMPTAPRVQLSLYADDALFTATSANLRMSRVYLQRQLDLLQPWLTKWRVKVNADKCEAISFTRSRRQDDGRHLTVDGRPVPWKTTVKYLGVLLDKTLTLTPHVNRVSDLASKGLASLGPLLNSKRLSTQFKLRLYTALLRPVITYAAPAWYHLASKTSRRKLLSVQSRSLRRATGSPWFVRNTVIRAAAKVPTIRDFVDSQIRRMEQTAEETTWDHVRALLRTAVPQLRRQMPE
jgi:hypothetical protein